MNVIKDHFVDLETIIVVVVIDIFLELYQGIEICLGLPFLFLVCLCW